MKSDKQLASDVSQMYRSSLPLEVEKAYKEMSKDINHLRILATVHALCLKPAEIELILFYPKQTSAIGLKSHFVTAVSILDTTCQKYYCIRIG